MQSKGDNKYLFTVQTDSHDTLISIPLSEQQVQTLLKEGDVEVAKHNRYWKIFKVKVTPSI